jgi:galactokinase
MARSIEAADLLRTRLGVGDPDGGVTVPGRVNLIGEHIDYHNLAVLPMAVPRSIRIAFRATRRRSLRALSGDGFGEREVPLDGVLEPGPPGDWANYLKAAVQAARTRWTLDRGACCAIVSDLPPAAGLSSSSALLTAATLVLLRANGINAAFEDLMQILPEGEHFVGTRGGGMDHAAVLACRPGAALLVGFAPLSTEPVAIPHGWEWLVAHSLVTAEKSGAVREHYNSRRLASTAGLRRLGFDSFGHALAGAPIDRLCARARLALSGDELLCFLHVVTEAARVRAAVQALRSGAISDFGRLLDESHASLRDQLQVSCPALDSLVESARSAGAAGARLTGAGFGGCAVILCGPGERRKVRQGLLARYYSGQSGFDPARHLIDAEPSPGALFA